MAVRAAPPMRPVRLADRIAPYLADTAPPSRLLARPTATSAPFTVARRLFGPALRDATRTVDRLVGGSASVRRRLAGLGSDLRVEDFRLEQVVWGAAAMLLGAVLAIGLGLLGAGVDVVLVVAVALGGLVTGVLGRDWWLSRQLAQREQAMLAEFPVVADLLALAVVAGEAPADALQRVCRLTGGEMARDLEYALRRARTGEPLTAALSAVAELPCSAGWPTASAPRGPWARGCGRSPSQPPPRKLPRVREIVRAQRTPRLKPRRINHPMMLVGPHRSLTGCLVRVVVASPQNRHHAPHRARASATPPIRPDPTLRADAKPIPRRLPSSRQDASEHHSRRSTPRPCRR